MYLWWESSSWTEKWLGDCEQPEWRVDWVDRSVEVDWVHDDPDTTTPSGWICKYNYFILARHLNYIQTSWINFLNKLKHSKYLMSGSMTY